MKQFKFQFDEPVVTAQMAVAPEPAAPATATCQPATGGDITPPRHAPLARGLWRLLHMVRPLLRGRLTVERVERMSDYVDGWCCSTQGWRKGLNKPSESYIVRALESVIVGFVMTATVAFLAWVFFC